MQTYMDMRSQSEIAEWLGMTRSAVNRWATGKGKPGFDWLVMLLEDHDPAKRLFARRCITAMYPALAKVDFSQI